MGGVQPSSESVTIVMAGISPVAEANQATVKADNRGAPVVPEPMAQRTFPALAAQASNLFQSVVAFVGDGCGIVDDAQYHTRLEICRTCDRLSGNRCVACGCFIYVKARGRIFHCPIDPFRTFIYFQAPRWPTPGDYQRPTARRPGCSCRRKHRPDVHIFRTNGRVKVIFCRYGPWSLVSHCSLLATEGFRRRFRNVVQKKANQSACASPVTAIISFAGPKAFTRKATP
jgi:hypothetical protein